MKKPRIDAFVEPEKAKSLASPLDEMPAIRPPRTTPAQATPSDPPTLAPAKAPVLPTLASTPSTPAAPETDPMASLPDAKHDFDEMPYRKHSCLLTPEEFNALDELKVALRKRFNSTITK